MARTEFYSSREDRRAYSRSYSFVEKMPYVDGSAAPAYENESTTSGASQLEFWKGFKKEPRGASDTIPANSNVVIRAAAYFIVMVLLVGFINITFVGATQSLAQEAESLQTSISQARESSKATEVQLGLLSNPTRIKEKAEEMGMSASSNPILIDLSDDVVVTDESGNISLTGSLAAISNK